MKNLKTILPICLVGVMAPTVAIVATSCGSSSLYTKPSKAESFTAKQSLHFEWTNVYPEEPLTQVDKNYPTPAEYAKEQMKRIGFDYSSLVDEIDLSAESTTWDKDTEALNWLFTNLDANVLELLIVMDVYNFVWTIHYHGFSEYSSLNDSYFEPTSYGSNYKNISSLSLDIDYVTSHYDESSKSYTYDFKYTLLAEGLGEDYTYSVIWSCYSPAGSQSNTNALWMDGQTLTFGTTEAKGVSLEALDFLMDDYKRANIHFNDDNEEASYTVTSPDGQPNTNIYKNLTNALLSVVHGGVAYASAVTTKDSTTPFFYTQDGIKTIFPGITIKTEA